MQVMVPLELGPTKGEAQVTEWETEGGSGEELTNFSKGELYARSRETGWHMVKIAEGLRPQHETTLTLPNVCGLRCSCPYDDCGAGWSYQTIVPDFFEWDEGVPHQASPLLAAMRIWLIKPICRNTIMNYERARLPQFYYDATYWPYDADRLLQRHVWG